MAHYSPALFALALFVIYSASNPVAQGQITTTLGLNVTGRVCCAALGVCSNGAAPAVGAGVSLRCPSVILAQPVNTITDANGSFSINATVRPGVGIIQLLVGILNPCTVNLQLNQTVCPQLIQSPTRAINLSSVVHFVGTILSETVTFVLGILSGFRQI